MPRARQREGAFRSRARAPGARDRQPAERAARAAGAVARRRAGRSRRSSRVYRAQEALGVLLVADGPVDATDEPIFAMPPETLRGCRAPRPGAERHRPSRRRPIRRSRCSRAPTSSCSPREQQLAERVLRDSSKDRLPFLEAVFQPSTTYPAQLFSPQNSWRLLLQVSVPLFDAGQRQGLKLERQAALDVSRATSDARADGGALGSARRARGDRERGARPRQRACRAPIRRSRS